MNPALRKLEGKVALVTGAAQGIGRAIVEAFSAHGASVIATDIRESALHSWVAPGGGVVGEGMDVTDAKSIAGCAKKHPDVEVLVNCAGLVEGGTIISTSRESFDRIYLTNVGSVFSVTQAFLPPMLGRKSGSIINVASVVSTVKAAPDRCAYAASKGAVLALTKAIAIDLIGHGIRCNAISPGTVHTPSLDDRMAQAPDPESALRDFIARQPVGRLGSPAEIAAVAVLLASDEVSFMTGSNIVVDGGFSL